MIGRRHVGTDHYLSVLKVWLPSVISRALGRRLYLDLARFQVDKAAS
jgi:hypothetical protein